MKTSNLIGPALDWAVAKCEGRKWPDNAAKFLGEQYYKPSADWSFGGPIIEREEIDLTKCDDADGVWTAWIYPQGCVATKDAYMCGGPTQLVAAMRCYVASKLGDEIEVPEELLCPPPNPEGRLSRFRCW